jgi:Ca2+-binding RTX toxin-like protein
MERVAALAVLAGALALMAVAGVAFAADIECQRGGQGGVPCLGTDGPDRLFGSNVYNSMQGLGDDDLLYGRGGPDYMSGDGGGQSTGATDGDDRLYGNLGRDDLYGKGGSDLLKGGADHDYIDAAEIPRNSGLGTEDTVIGGGGADRIVALDFNFDAVDCGAGFDSVTYDAGLDEISANCERQIAED